MVKTSVNAFVAGNNAEPTAICKFSTSFCKFLNTCVGSFSNIFLRSSAPLAPSFLNARITTSLVSLPCAASSLSSPVETFNSSASGFKINGTCSETLLNSSPAKRPEPSACANCLNAFDASCADAPPSFAAVLKPINVVSISAKLTPKGFNLAVILVTPSSASVALIPNNF